MNAVSYPAVLLAFLLAALLTALAPVALAAQQPAEPLGILLTWQRDPTTTMTIDWHTAGPLEQPAVEYRRAGTEDWQRAGAESHPFPFSTRMIHRVELTGLQPGADYEFRCGADPEVYRFRTMPATLNRPVRFVAGGDLLHRKDWLETTNRVAASYDPDFALFGGDLAYANGMEENVGKWHDWLDAMKNTLVTEEGRLIPIVAAIGNHEVRGGYFHRDSADNRINLEPYEGDNASRERIAPYYFELFATPGQPGYGVIDFGEYLSVILLDTDHANPIDGEQKEWLEEVLEDRDDVPHLFPIYHVPAYPSVRRFEGDVHRRVREHWVPLFEEHGVRVAFENHDHVYKRTYPLREDEVSPGGVVYIGDGAWGTDPREIRIDHAGEEKPWYAVSAEPVRHFVVVTLDGTHQHFLMVDAEGNVFDEYPSTPGRELHEYDREAEAEAADWQAARWYLEPSRMGNNGVAQTGASIVAAARTLELPCPC